MFSKVKEAAFCFKWQWGGGKGRAIKEKTPTQKVPTAIQKKKLFCCFPI